MHNVLLPPKKYGNVSEGLSRFMKINEMYFQFLPLFGLPNKIIKSIHTSSLIQPIFPVLFIMENLRRRKRIHLNHPPPPPQKKTPNDNRRNCMF